MSLIWEQIDFSNYSKLFIAANVVMALCTVLVVIAISIDFLLFHKQTNVKKNKNSWVETGSMFLYFFLFYGLLQLPVGSISVEYKLNIMLIGCGVFLVVVGCVVNVLGRTTLKHQWANQVVIYSNHTFVNSGVYSRMRHPLYASIIWMLVGASIVYVHYIALFSVLLVFLPMMHFRAWQEEKILQVEFPEYLDYIRKTHRFIPFKFKR